MEQKISKEELDERVAILKKFRMLLEQQRKKFQEYLKVLESQENKIAEEDSDSLMNAIKLQRKFNWNGIIFKES